MVFALVLVWIQACQVQAQVKRTFPPVTITYFYDDFKTFDLSTWEHEITMGGGGNWEFQMYWNNRTNSYVRDGILYLMPTLMSGYIGESKLTSGHTLDLWGSGTPASKCTGNAFYGCSRTSGGGGNILNPVLSARIRTVNTVTLQYGRVEVRAQLPRGDWLWPAIWLLPKYNMYGDWPASGEIDIMESRGNAAGYPAGGNNVISSAIHFGPSWDADTYLTGQTGLSWGSFADSFHTFGLFWNEEGLYTYVDHDSNRVLQVPFNQTFWERSGKGRQGYANPWMGASRAAPFDQEFYVILNLAVGGTNGYFPDNQGGKCWQNSSPHAINDFWNCRNSWLPTWRGEDAAFKIDWIVVTSK
eukprot:g51708.t1